MILAIGGCADVCPPVSVQSSVSASEASSRSASRPTRPMAASA